jgi:signal transduction histidine kinase
MNFTGFHFYIVVIYFIYGLAFFSMGLSLSLENMRSPLLADRRVLRPLIVFGLLHGAHEWIEIFLLQGVWSGIQFPMEAIWLRLIWLVVSFIPLIVFGVLMLHGKPLGNLWSVILSAGSLSLFMFILYLDSLSQGAVYPERVDPLARYFLALPGGILAGLGLWALSRQMRREGQTELVSRFLWAAIGFGLYGLTQVFVSPVDMFLARNLNAGTFMDVFGFPVQLVRALVAVLITLNLIRAIQIVAHKREDQLISVQRDRLEALEQIQLELEEKEALRRELLRHTVIAQEDERARIARELHDETAQFLTALSLNLATLRGMLPESQEMRVIAERLQSLIRQMSQGIYRIVHDLRPAQLDDLGLVAALQVIADQELRRTGLRVTLQVVGNVQRLDTLIETVIFRVAQEAITNVARHARCDKARIELLFEPDEVYLIVSDRGVGIQDKAESSIRSGWGLEGIRERAESVGGRFRVYSPPEGGTVVAISIPIEVTTVGEEQEIFHERYPIDVG